MHGYTRTLEVLWEFSWWGGLKRNRNWMSQGYTIYYCPLMFYQPIKLTYHVSLWLLKYSLSDCDVSAAISPTLGKSNVNFYQAPKGQGVSLICPTFLGIHSSSPSSTTSSLFPITFKPIGHHLHPTAVTISTVIRSRYLQPGTLWPTSEGTCFNSSSSYIFNHRARGSASMYCDK